MNNKSNTKNSKTKNKNDNTKITAKSYSVGPVKVLTNSIYGSIGSLSEVQCGSYQPPSDTPTPVQKYGIPIILNKQSLIVRAPTGMGKTLCFLMPLIHNTIENSRKKENNKFNSRYENNHTLKVCVISPTRELCEQIKVQCEEILSNVDLNNKVEVSPWCRDIKIDNFSDLKIDKFSKNKVKNNSLFVESVYGQKKEFINLRVDFIIATPGRLLDLLQRGKINFDDLEAFVLDEADKLLDMGFEPDIRKIHSFLRDSKIDSSFNQSFSTNFDKFLSDIKKSLNEQMLKTQICLFSATYNKNLKNIINDFLGENRFSVEVENEVIENIKQEFLLASKNPNHNNSKDSILASILSQLNLSSSWARPANDKCIIFVEKKSTAKELESKINKNILVKFLENNFNMRSKNSSSHDLNVSKTYNWSAVSLHGDKDQGLRALAIKNFKENRIPILIATSVGARGIDIKDVTLVINYDFPGEIKEYIHRIGRTGRSGKAGKAITIIEKSDSVMQNYHFKHELINVLNESKNIVPKFLLSGNQSISPKSVVSVVTISDSKEDSLVYEKGNYSKDNSFIDEKEDSDGDLNMLW